MRSSRILHVPQDVSDHVSEDPKVIFSKSNGDGIRLADILVVSREDSCTVFGPLGVISGILNYWEYCGRGPTSNASSDGSQLRIEGAFEDVKKQLEEALKFACDAEVVEIERQQAYA